MKKLNAVCQFTLLLAAVGAVQAQSLVFDNMSLSFSAQLGGAPVSQTINVSSTGAAILFYLQPVVDTGNWLSVTPASGTAGSTPSPLSVTVDPTGLAAGVHYGHINIHGGNGNNNSIVVTFAVSTISISPQPPVSMTYVAGSGSFPSVSLQLSAPAFTQYTTQIPGSSNCSWLSLVPTSGSVPGGANTSTLTVVLNPSVVLTLSSNTYSCSFTVTPSNSTSAPISVPVNLTVSANPAVTVSPSAVFLNYQNTTTVYPSQVLTLTSNGTQALTYSLGGLSTDPGYTGSLWFTLSKASGTLQPPANSDTVTLSYNSSVALSPGTYRGQVTVTVNNATETIPVQLLVSNSPLLNVSTSTLTFTSELNGSSPAPATVNVTSTSGQLPISYNLSYTSGGNWLFAAVGATTTSGTPITVSVNTSGLALGQYKGTISVYGSGAANNPQTVAVTLNVANDALISTNVSTSEPLVFPFQTGLTATAPAPQAITVSSSTGVTLGYTATAAANAVAGCGTSWLSLSGATSGNTAGTFTAAANPAGIVPGAAGLVCTGTITITATNPTTGAAAPNSPYVIPVSLDVSRNALLVVSPATAPAFSAQVGMAGSVVSQNCAVNGSTNCRLTLNSTSPTDQLTVSVNFSTTDGSNWLFATPVSGSIPLNGSMALTIGLAFVPPTPGSYSGLVTITATDASAAGVLDSPVIIPVTLQVTAGLPTATPTSLTFTQTLGGTVPATQTISVGSSTGQALNFTAAATVSTSAIWLTVSPTSGATPGTLTVTANGSQLTPSATPYQGQITITGAGSANVVTVPVTLAVSAGTIAATPVSLTFSEVQGGSAPPSQNITLSGTPGAINFTTSETTATGGSAWLTVTPASGATPGTLKVGASAGSLTPGNYTGSVIITAPGATGSPLTIPITLTVLAPQTITVAQSSLTFNYVAGAQAPQPQTVQVLSASGAAAITAAAATNTGGNWLQVTPASGNTPVALSVAVTPQSLPAGTYTGTITVTSPSALAPLTVGVTLTVVAIPTPVLTAIKNAASYASGAIAPGENIVLGGTGIGPAALAGLQLTSGGAVSTIVSGTQVLFDNVPAPIVYASATQTSVIVPFEVAGRATTQVVVMYQGAASAPLTYNVVQAQPGIYALNQQGSGPGAILNQDFSVNGPNKPAPKGSYVAVYLTGIGQTSPQGLTGGVALLTASGQKMSLLPVTATVGGVPVPTTAVAYAGTAPGFVEGVIQVNLQIPAAAASGADPLVITFGASNTAATFSTQAGITVQVQ